MKRDWLLISFPEITWKRIANLFQGIALGVCLGAIGILFHNSYSPYGLLIALLESGMGFYYFGRELRGTFIRIISYIAWLAIVYKAANFGVSQEILIQGNRNGFVFLIGGMAINFFALIRAKNIK